jgi:hypothetical protein
MIGFNIPSVKLMTMGDFLMGADYDLVSDVYPVFNMLDPMVGESQIRIDAGFSSLDAIAKVRVVNMLPTVNKNQKVFNGTKPALLQINPWNEEIAFGNATNGMQYQPFDSNDYITHYDNRILRVINLTYNGTNVAGTFNS